MRSANCSPISHPMLPPTHQHHMWYLVGSYLITKFMLLLSNSNYDGITCFYCRDAWDMAAEICLSQLPSLVADPNAEYQVCFRSDFVSHIQINEFLSF